MPNRPPAVVYLVNPIQLSLSFSKCSLYLKPSFSILSPLEHLCPYKHYQKKQQNKIDPDIDLFFTKDGLSVHIYMFNT